MRASAPEEIYAVESLVNWTVALGRAEEETDWLLSCLKDAEGVPMSLDSPRVEWRS